ncbi:MAG: hypothetical protein Ct9H300mP6_07870 [Gammaproteobacteria bacterium]|nr:MAG: hypothetical protein Ct9H300mP6_07870 [Gammaproteobacteria bacterium]
MNFTPPIPMVQWVVLGGFCSEDGRATIIMPHPERVIRKQQHSWCPPEWEEDGPWLQIFYNAREWIG